MVSRLCQLEDSITEAHLIPKQEFYLHLWDFQLKKEKTFPNVRKKNFFKKPENCLKAHYQEIVSTVFMTVLNVL